MATILGEDTDHYISFLDEDFDKDDEDFVERDNKISLWIEEGKTIRPSTNVKLLKSLKPGVYKSSWNRDFGYFCEKLSVKSDELYAFSDGLMDSLISEVNNFWDKKDIYSNNNFAHKRGILLEGTPGCGKSSLITLLSNEIIKRNGIVFIISNIKEFENYVEFLRIGLREIEANTPIISVIEDIDMYEQVQVQLLDFLDGKMSINHHIVIATTNNSEEIEDTILRPSRLDLRIEMKPPTKEIRKEFLEKKNISKELVNDLVNKSDGFSFAELKELFISVVLLDYSVEDAVFKIKNPKEKKNYKVKSLNNKKIGFNKN